MEEVTASSNVQTRTQNYRKCKIQGNVIPLKKYNKLPGTDKKGTEICKFSDSLFFKVIVLKKLSELQKNTDKPSNEIRKTIPPKNEKFNEEEEV